jgi:hypothetical protein
MAWCNSLVQALIDSTLTQSRDPGPHVDPFSPWMIVCHLIWGAGGPINTTTSLFAFHSICNKPTATRLQREREREPHIASFHHFQEQLPLQRARTGRDGDAHGRQEQDAAFQEGEPEVGVGVGVGVGGAEEPAVQGRRGQVGAGPPGGPGEGAEGQVLHHAPLRHHARVLEGLARASGAHLSMAVARRPPHPVRWMWAVARPMWAWSCSALVGEDVMSITCAIYTD